MSLNAVMVHVSDPTETVTSPCTLPKLLPAMSMVSPPAPMLGVIELTLGVPESPYSIECDKLWPPVATTAL